MGKLVPGTIPHALQPYAEEVDRLRRASVAFNTRRTYKAAWEHFDQWCEDHGLESLPATPETVENYLAWCANHGGPENKGYKTSSILLRKTAISQAHRIAEEENPCTSIVVQTVLRGIINTKGIHTREAKPISKSLLREMIEALPDSLLGIRDRALLLVGFAGALRRSEIAALQVAHVEDSAEGVTLTFYKSKTNQEGRKEIIGLLRTNDLCPVRALQQWRHESDVHEGYLFRPMNQRGEVLEGPLSGNAICDIVKRSLERIDIIANDYSGHSLRAGFATEASRQGVSEYEIMKQTRHKNLNIARKYIREGSVLNPDTNASRILGGKK
jgi:integrase